MLQDEMDLRVEGKALNKCSGPLGTPTGVLENRSSPADQENADVQSCHHKVWLNI